MGQLSQNSGGSFFENGFGGFDGLLDAKTHAGVCRDENVVAWSGDGLHFRHQPGLRVWRDYEGEEEIV